MTRCTCDTCALKRLLDLNGPFDAERAAGAIATLSTVLAHLLVFAGPESVGVTFSNIIAERNAIIQRHQAAPGSDAATDLETAEAVGHG